MRRIAGLFLALTGLALLAFAGAGYVRASLARDRARAKWQAMAERQPSADGGGDARRTAPARTVARGEPIGRLIIRAVGLDEVVVEGVDRAQLEAGPGHVPGTALPGEAGNSVISAHRDRHFHALGKVELGDTVITETTVRTRAWVITASRIAEAGKPAIYPTEGPTLTLTTCWPIRYVGPAPDRLLLTAEPVN